MNRGGFSRIFEQAADLPRAIRRLGPGATATLVRSHLSMYSSRLGSGRRPRPHTLRCVRPRGCAAPLYYRDHTSDINVLQQVFLTGEYDCAAAEPDVEFIVDCGANTGCASVFFLNRYPTARVRAIEADARSFEVCRMNLEPYGGRVEAIHGAIWPTSEPLIVDRGEGGQAEPWAFRVRPCREGEPREIDGISLASLVHEAPRHRIDLLKIDIEGGERELFTADVEPWLPWTRTLVIELHGPDCESAFFEAMERHRFRVEKAGYVWIARRSDPI